MNFPSDTIQGSPTFHSTISKQVDGTFKASCTIPEVPTVSAPTESQAILKLRYAVEQFFGHGGKEAKK